MSLGLGRDRRGLDPLLGLLLERPVERGDDGVAAGVDCFARVREVFAAQDRAELVADLPDEVGGQPVGADRRLRITGSARGRVEVGRVNVRFVSGSGWSACIRVEDQVPAADDLRSRGDDELRLAGRAVRRPRRP